MFICSLTAWQSGSMSAHISQHSGNEYSWTLKHTQTNQHWKYIDQLKVKKSKKNAKLNQWNLYFMFQSSMSTSSNFNCLVWVGHWTVEQIKVYITNGIVEMPLHYL